MLYMKIKVHFTDLFQSANGFSRHTHTNIHSHVHTHEQHESETSTKSHFMRRLVWSGNDLIRIPIVTRYKQFNRFIAWNSFKLRSFAYALSFNLSWHTFIMKRKTM